MLENTPSKLNFRISDLAKAAIGILNSDGGCIIAVQIFSFLFSYFCIQTAPLNNQSFPTLNKANFIMVLVSILNLAVIIYRTVGIANGKKFSLADCYLHAIKRLPSMITLYLLGCTAFILLSIPLLRALGAVTPEAIMRYHILIEYCLLSFMPCVIFAYAYLIDQEKSSLQAIRYTFKTFKERFSLRMILNLAMLYTAPLCFSGLMAIPAFMTPYLALIKGLWFLFCHVLTIVIYVGSTINTEPAKSSVDDSKTSKVIII